MINSEKTGAIAWMASNPVAANLLMLFIMIGGYMMARTIKQEVFPEFDIDVVMVSMVYPGASPEEVEEGIVLAIEEGIRDIVGVKKIASTAAEGRAVVTAELLTGADPNKVLQDVKSAVDRITTLPENAERPIVRLIVSRRNVITLVLYGDIEEVVLSKLAEQVRDEILQSPKITSVELSGVRPREISIEISQDTLRKHNLTLTMVAAKIRAASVDFSAGGVKAESGEILLRVRERRNFGMEYADIPIVSNPDGSIVRLGELSKIIDGFADTDEAAFFNGKRAIMINVKREGNQTPIMVADEVKRFVADLENRLSPMGVGVATFDDRSEIYKGRRDLLRRNGTIGLALVLVLLGLFLNARLAFWVTMGIPISFMGAFLFLPLVGVSINVISMFAFIMALGIVVDDAIVVGENIYTQRREQKSLIDAAVVGVRQVSTPVVFAVVTNIVAFLPIMFMGGIMGKVFRVIPIVVCIAFAMSLVEALFILPAHLAHTSDNSTRGVLGRLAKIQGRVSSGLEYAIEKFYRPLLKKALDNRYITVSIGIAILMIVIGYVRSGRIPIAFAPNAEADVVSVGLEMPFGSPVEETIRVQKQLVEAARRALEQFGGEEAYEGIFTLVGASTMGGMQGARFVGGHAANIRVYLASIEERDFTGAEFTNAWRDEIGEIPGVEKIFFEVLQIGPPAGKPIAIRMSHSNHELLEAAAIELAGELREFDATRDVDDGVAPGKPQLDFRIKPEAYSLGLTPFEIGSQVRARFFGAEALRLQRGRNEVKVMVKLPEEERRTIRSIEGMIIRTPAGGELTLGEAATVVRGRAYTEIERNYGRRTVDVTSDVTHISKKGAILESLSKSVMPELEKKYPGLTYSLEGEQRDIAEAFSSLLRNFFIAMIAIYVILGVVFRSYIQPVIIMVSIPFGIVGAVVGHILMGFNLSVISMMGIVALSGVVLNDSLVLIDFANRLREEGQSHFDAVYNAGVRRFRPIMLTTLTTFGGLAPMIFERSFQARIVVPMAVSLGYGILFATMIILLLVPSFYLIVEDMKDLFGAIKSRISHVWTWMWYDSTE